MTENQKESELLQQAIAIAAVLQALRMVSDIAMEGRFDPYHAVPLFNSLVYYGDSDVNRAFGDNLLALIPGLRAATRFFTNEHDAQTADHLAEYVVKLFIIESRLMNKPEMHQKLQTHVQSFAQDFNQTFAGEESISQSALVSYLTDENLMLAFSNLYRETASLVEPRIIVRGNPAFLQDEHNTNQVRALLLSGLRAVGFFRQTGGSYMNLVLKRHTYLATLNSLVDNA